MKRQTIGSIARFAEATLNHPENADLPVRSVSIDTRTLDQGDIYMPIIGEKLDGHEFMDQAFRLGAVASFCDYSHAPADPSYRNYLLVNDTYRAFQKTAANYRQSLDVHIIGITGSNGKTTTKDIVSSVLRQRYRTTKTMGNLNNGIGVPRTLLDLDEDAECGVIEMGMSGLGEISELVRMARPEVAVITNVGDAHLEQLKTRENIAKAKLEILEGMNASQLFLYNSDNEILCRAVKEREILPKVRTFGTSPEADYRLQLVSANAGGTTFLVNGESWTTNLLGAYQIYNAAVAVILGRYYGLSNEEIRAGLQVADVTQWRAQLEHFNGFDIFVDVYKSNPQSLLEGMRTVELLNGYRRKIAILGDMLELGENEQQLHKEVGKKINPEVFDDVLFFGELSRAMRDGALEHFDPSHVYHFERKQDLVDMAKYLIVQGTLVFIKGSRAMRLEEVVESLQSLTAR